MTTLNNQAVTPTSSSKAWFESWFDSPYYEEIYDHRTLSEAQGFIERLTQHLALPPTAQILDLGCGWGRHTRSFAALGYTTTGLDLSPRLIAKAQEHFIRPHDPVSDRMTFRIGDMRDFQLNTRFDAIVNLFTSFGYFDDAEQDQKVLHNVHRHLKADGFLVLDYFNKEAVLMQLNESEFRQGLKFNTKISRTFQDGHLLKSIEIIHRDSGLCNEVFTEKVRCYEPDELRDLLTLSGFEVQEHWGNYQLSPAEHNSPRCILLARPTTTLVI